MCCFSGPVAHVADTNLFARASTGNRQFLVYQMQLQSAADTAMILPLPVPPRSREDAIRFIDLSSYPNFFADLRKPFMDRGEKTRTGGGPALSALPEPRLAVHNVGSFEASFVPSLEDFDRLDQRFRLPRASWDQRYHDWGFAVFKLREISQLTAVEPMAFEWPRRDDSALYFPTVHIHDGVAHARAEYDHNLFLQSAVEEEVVAVGNYARSTASSSAPARDFTSALHARGILDENLPIQVVRFEGSLHNHDALVPAPRAPWDDPELAAFRMWRADRQAIPVEAAVALVRRFAAARSSSEVTPQSLAAGIAAIEGLPRAHQHLWSISIVADYGSPEACRGEPTDERSDVYSLAALLYHLVNGRTLFGEYMTGVVGHVMTPAPSLGTPSPALNELAARALAKDPAERFQSVRELAQALAQL